MSGISTHVLNTATGRPGSGIPVSLFHGDTAIASEITSDEGRCPALLPHNVMLEADTYRLVFDLAASFPDYFYPAVEITFRVADPSAHYHVPLLLSPFGYTTYRGS
jgi:5-hydroxyisourate hydrolase